MAMELLFLLDTDLLSDRELLGRCRLFLSEARLQKADSFRRERDRWLSLGAGMALDMALASFGLREKTAKMTCGPHGKPRLEESGVFFNLSHSGHYAVCAVSDKQEVGVDIQKIRPVREALLRKACTSGEKALLEALPPGEREEQFCRLWTVKESYMKLLGTGLSLGAARLETDLGRPPTLRREGALQKVCFTQWELPDHRLTLCTRFDAAPQLKELTMEDLWEHCR